MISSPPASPDGGRVIARPQSLYSMPSPDALTKSRPQSMITKPVRSQSRLSQSSKHGGSRASDEDAKTSVKVVVRVRPPLGPNDPGFDLIPQRFQRSMVQVSTNTSLAVDSPHGRKIFVFDRVFGEDTHQQGVWDYLQDSVDSFLQGYNVSILAYGQSGSGKSFTMGTSGPKEQFDPSLKGVIPRAAQHLFQNLSDAPAHSRHNSGIKSPTRFSVSSMNQVMQSARSNMDKGWDMTVTYVEIYNEHPRDLLLTEDSPLGERPNVQIREDRQGRIFVEGLNSVRVSSFEDLMRVLNHGSTIRQTDATAINARSSRSHAVFTINLRQTKAQGFSSHKRASSAVDSMPNGGDLPMTVESKLHFVDLAGSERLKNTGATGDRAREGISINAGLASLGKVISQLSSRTPGTYVSYRDSKLTRMLQDSLGGNAITYMIACVTPAEFHLSETLNTVQYAQRARNIQSKPKIQHIDDSGDKQAVIERLRSEIAFLRQQIRSSETNGERRGAAIMDRPDRSSERENELHNQLLDAQESYNALSQRHAKLISELTKNAESTDLVPSMTSESAIDRLKRSQANQEMIEQVVMEYEKTIQSLEANLANTRSSLSTTESSLLEKETKCAYAESMNQQLNARVQKMMDRESNTEQYLHDLEGRLQDKSTGSDKNDAIISDLRKEITRIRESETNAEDYICTLEERLAEADQDMEIMQREVERLEHLVERQRSLGKLDNLLYELDHIHDREGKPKINTSGAHVNGVSEAALAHEKQQREEILRVAEATELPEEKDNELDEATADKQSLDAALSATKVDGPTTAATFAAETVETDDVGLQQLQNAVADKKSLKAEVLDEPLPSPAQSKFVAEKFESVSQELFDLRLEHESTINELDLLSAKYQEALRTLAEMQDSIDESRHSGTSSAQDNLRMETPASHFLEDTVPEEVEDGQDLPPSRSLSSELSLAGESSTSVDTDITPVSKKTQSVEVAAQEIGRLQTLLSQHEKNMQEVTDQYTQLQTDHKEALSTVERLKAQVQRDRPKSPGTPGILRRMTSQSTAIDRGHRSVASLRTLMAEEFEEKPDRMETAEVHLTAATHELSARADRIQALEAEVKNIKKEMDVKSTIISGLTRERTSIKAGSPVDLNMVSQLRDQIISKETELKSMHEGYARREQELQEEIQRHVAEKSTLQQASKAVPEHEQQLKSLQDELSQASSKHRDAQLAAEGLEKQFATAKSELDAALATVETLKAQQVTGDGDVEVERGVAATAMQKERDNFNDLISKLKAEVEQYKSINAEHNDKNSELSQLHASLSKDFDSHSATLKARDAEIIGLKDEIARSQGKIKEAESAIEFHRNGLKSVHDAHATEMEEMKLTHAGNMAGYDDQISEMTAKHEKLISTYKKDLEHALSMVDKIVKGAQTSLGHPTTADMLASHIQDLVEEKRVVAEANTRLAGANGELERQLDGRQNLIELEEDLEASKQKISNYQETIRTLANEVGNHEEAIRDKDALIKKHEASIEEMEMEKKKKSEIIEELEQQLQNSFDQHHNRVSLIQAQGNQALIEAQQRIAILEKDLDQRRSINEAGSDSGSRSNTMKSQRPQSPLLEAGVPRSNSMTSNLRKSASIASLPSPPPAIPLPPLPTLPGLQVASANASNPSPPQSRHTSKEVTLPITPVSNTAVSSKTHSDRRHSALIEEQETRLRTIEKHLHAEKQLTATLEEALVDLETQSNKLRVDADGWKKKAWAMEEELVTLRKEKRTERLSVQAVEEEVKKRREAEAARAQLEERMRLLQGGKDGKKKRNKASLNCF